MNSNIKSLLLCCLLLILFRNNSTAQAAAKSSTLHSFNSVQLLNGGSTVSASIHSVNGLQWNKFFAGIGVGFDYYYHTSIPVFVEGRYDIIGEKRKLQAFVNAGMHVPFSNVNQQAKFKTGDFKIGKLLAGGIDYLIPIKTDALIFGVAYSQKQSIQMVNNNIWNPALNRFENVPIKEDYEFNRIWIKLGWVF